jgi:plastocyanin
MRRCPLWIAALCGVWIFGTVFAGEAAKTGIVKGTITISGRPATDVVVSVEGVSPQQIKTQLASGKPKAVMEQKDLKFTPRVLAVLSGTTVDFPNHDKTFHNVYSNSETKKFDLGLYPSGKSRSVTFDKVGVVRILCNAHPNMEAYIVVKNHPYFIVPDARGNYSLNGIPLGKYRVEVWHPELGKRITPIELVREGEVLDIGIDLKRQ